MKKLWTWFRRYWKYILVVPAILIGLFWLARWIILLVTDLEDPDMTDLERDLRSDMDRMDDKERELLNFVNDEEKKIKDGIDRGDPKPSEIFNEEVNPSKENNDN